MKRWQLSVLQWMYTVEFFMFPLFSRNRQPRCPKWFSRASVTSLCPHIPGLFTQ